MNQATPERRLSAILAADVAGYSRLVGQDEEGTIAALNRALDTVVAPAVKQHRGRVVKTMGDGLLAEFASAVDATRCAMEIQRRMAETNAAADGHRLQFRIGIHVGDVIHQEGDILGDGVNIAARIEGLAEPGAICLTDAVYALVRGKLDLDAADMGERDLKNIARPVRVYAVGFRPEPTTCLSLPDKPSIAVLPFVNLGRDPEQEYFVDGITQEIITSLSRLRWLFVIAGSSTFTYKHRDIGPKQAAQALGVRYVVTGSVRQAGNRIRVTCELADGVTGAQVWARRFDHATADVFELQDEITRMIVGAIEPELGRAERERASVKRPDSLDAWTMYQRGMSFLVRGTKQDLAEARHRFEQAIAMDPRLGAAYTGIAEACYYESVYGFATSAVENREKALAAAQRAVSLDPDDAAAHCTLGRIRYLRHEYPAALSELQTAINLNPSLALAHYGLGAALVFSGRAAESFEHLENAIRLSPYDPNMGSYLVRIAEAKYLLGQDEEAIAYALRALGQPGIQWSRYAVLIAALGQLGRTQEASRYLEEIRNLRPEFCIAFVCEMHPFGADFGLGRYVEGLRKAGVPEHAA